MPIPKEALDIVVRAKATPEDPNSQEVLRVAKDKGWLDEPPDISEQPISKTESALRGAGQGITAGFQEEASAGLEKGMIKLNNLMQEYPMLAKALKVSSIAPVASLIDQGQKIPEPSYKEIRDKMRGENKAAREANPWTYGVSEVGGGVLSTIPLGAAGSTVKGMTALGAATGAGTSEKEGLDVAKDAALGAGLGLVLGTGGKILSSSRGAAETAGLKALKLDAPTLRRLEVKGDVLKEVKAISRAMIDKGILGNPTTANSKEKMAFALMKKVGQTLDDGYGQLDKLVPDGVLTKNSFKDQILGAIKADNPLMDDKVIASVSGELDKLLPKIKGVVKGNQYETTSKLGFKDMWNLVKEIDDKSRIYERASDPAYETAADALNQVATKIRGIIGANAEKVSPEISGVITPNSSLYSQAATARKAFADTVRRGVSKNKAIAGQGAMDRILGATIESTPYLGAKTGLLNILSKVAPPSVVTPATKAAIIKSSNRSKEK